MKKLPFQDRRFLDAAEGWLGLGDHSAANEELEQITPELRADPIVLEVRLQISWAARKWDACVEIAGALVKLKPGNDYGWIGRSFALHELKRTQEGHDLLLPAGGNITLLSRINDFWWEFCSAAVTVPGQAYQPRLHRMQNLFPRNTRSFF